MVAALREELNFLIIMKKRAYRTLEDEALLMHTHIQGFLTAMFKGRLMSFSHCKLTFVYCRVESVTETKLKRFRITMAAVIMPQHTLSLSNVPLASTCSFSFRYFLPPLLIGHHFSIMFSFKVMDILDLIQP